MLKIALAIPVLENVPGEAFGIHLAQSADVAKSMTLECGKNWQMQFYCPQNQYPHDRARNMVFKEALDNGADLLFFIDDDTLVPVGAFQELRRALIENGAAVVSGHYYRRGWPYHCVWSKELETIDQNEQKGQEFFPVDAGSGLHEIHTTGLGCALIDLHWVKAHLKAPWCELEKRNGECIVSDDITFLDKVRRAGGLILGHAGIRCVHLADRMPVCDDTVAMLRKHYAERQVVVAL